MKQYRIYFIRDDKRLTKLVYAETFSEVKKMFRGTTIVRICQIDSPQEEDEI